MRYVTAVVFDDDELDVLLRALRGHALTLGEDEKERPVVGRHLHRLEAMHARLKNVGLDDGPYTGEVYLASDLASLRAALDGLYDYFAERKESSWWREQMPPAVRELSGEDAVLGLANESTQAACRALTARELVDRALGTAGREAAVR